MDPMVGVLKSIVGPELVKAVEALAESCKKLEKRFEKIEERLGEIESNTASAADSLDSLVEVKMK